MNNIGTTRREFLSRASGGFGTIALAGMLGQNIDLAEDPLKPRIGHHAAKADRVIFLYSTGGVSQVDTFNHRPQLTKDHGKSITASRWLNTSGEFKRFLIKPRYQFKQYGQSGAWVSELFPHLGSVIDDICVLNAMHCDSDGHDKATLAAHTGSAQFARPSAGSWISYGLGTENQNLPSFITIAPKQTYAGTQVYASDFLPGAHQGTFLRPSKNPFKNISSRVPVSRQELELAALQRLNERHLIARSGDAQAEARIKTFETAFGMQMEVPELFDFSKESDATHNLYGLQRGTTEGFGWQCLAARRLIERGVRFVELIDTGSSGNWDSHGNMMDHERLAKNVDQPIAGLLKDLKSRGMFEDTLVVWTTEFGRTPFNNKADAPGREHHNWAFSSWMAGAGIKPGTVHGSTDEYGIRPDKDPVHVHDFHATILHLLGLDHERLTYRHDGRDYRLTDVYGEIASDILG